MNTRALGLLVSVAATAFAHAAQSVVVESGPMNVCIDTQASILWKTAVDWPLEVQLDWPLDATKAVVSIAGAPGWNGDYEVTDTSLSSYRFDRVCPASDAEERVIDLSIRYYNSSDVEIADAASAARVGLVRSVGAGSARVVTAGPSARRWGAIDSAAVVRLPEGTASVSVDGVRQEGISVPGWFYTPVEVGVDKQLTLVTDAGSVTRTICGKAAGSLILFR